MVPEEIKFLRSVKGAALSVLMAFMFEQKPLGHDYLVRVTGWSKTKVTEGIQILNDLGYIESASHKRYNGWVLTAKLHQLGLFEGNPKLWASNDDTSTTALIVREDNQEGSRSINNREAQIMGFDVIDEFKQRTQEHKKNINLNALHSLGIMGKTAVDLAGRDYMTLDYIKAHGDRAKREGTPIGILITRMRDHDPAPAQVLTDFDPERYISGPYADYIRH